MLGGTILCSQLIIPPNKLKVFLIPKDSKI